LFAPSTAERAACPQHCSTFNGAQRPEPVRSSCNLLLLTLGLLLGACRREAPPPRPNFIVILADDMGYSDVGAYGGEIATPHLDALAEGGLRFTQFYNAARCCPTRAALLTGLYPHQAGMGDMVSSLESDPAAGPYQGYLNDRSATLAEALGTAGYRTYMAGKWHVGEKPAHWPRQRGFDRYFGLISGASSYFEVIKDQPRVRQMVLDDATWEPPAEGFYMTDAITDYAVRYVEEHAAAQAEAPFLLYVAYTAPHWPLHALPEDIDRYRGRYDAGWDTLRAERFARMRALGIVDDRHALSERPATIPAWDDVDGPVDWAVRMAVYAAMVDRMDQGIGRIVEALRAAGQYDDTLILFLSDNGGCAEEITGRGLHDPAAPIGTRGSYVAYREPWANASNTPFRRYKRWTHEGGIRTPLIAHWPAGLAPQEPVTPQVGHVIDLMPTLLELAGASFPDSLQGQPVLAPEGQSLAPVFQGRAAAEPRTLFWEHEGSRAVRQGRWKLVYADDAARWELYDLEADPVELNDLAAAQPERVRTLDSLWTAWAARVGVFAQGR
jgi:arylsulfatase A-like enzyme